MQESNFRRYRLAKNPLLREGSRKRIQQPCKYPEKIKAYGCWKVDKRSSNSLREKTGGFLPECKAKVCFFATNDTSYIIDMQDYTGDLFYLIEEAERYILKNIHIGMRLEGLKKNRRPGDRERSAKRSRHKCVLPQGLQ